MSTPQATELLTERRSTLLKLIHTLGKFEEAEIVQRFAEAIRKEVEPRLSKSVRRVLRELVEYGVLDQEGTLYALRR